MMLNLYDWSYKVQSNLKLDTIQDLYFFGKKSIFWPSNSCLNLILPSYSKTGYIQQSNS
jgi:hypothetical protein